MRPITDAATGNTTTATKEQTIEGLTSLAGGWPYTARASTTPLRRPIFLNGDKFFFSAAGDNLSLRVLDDRGRLVLGKDLLLAWDAALAAFTVTAYGRHMEFRAIRADAPVNWLMNYRCEYEAGPHHAPDEGGDGDPT